MNTERAKKVVGGLMTGVWCLLLYASAISPGINVAPEGLTILAALTLAVMISPFDMIGETGAASFALGEELVGKARVSETSDHDPREPKSAKQRYVDGEIDEMELERELEDELTD